MVEINLLPWREAKRAYQHSVMKKILVVTLIVTLLFLLSFHYKLTSQETALQVRIDVLQQKEDESQQKILRKQTEPLATPPRPQFQMTALYAELSKMNDYDVCFTQIVRTHNMTLFSGKTRSAADLTDYLKKWNIGNLFSQIKINQLEKKNHATFQFRFTAV